MLISLTWIRDFVDLPPDIDPKELAERFTRTTAEVEGVEAVRVSAKGLVAARVVETRELPDTRDLRLVTLDVGGKKVETVTAAPVLHLGGNVVYAPPGASVANHPEFSTAQVAGHASVGMIPPGEMIGIPVAIQEAVFLDNTFEPGQPLAPELFEDDVIEVDNKSITHRPDLWGHYGIAREIAAIYSKPLKPYPVTTREQLTDRKLPEIPITIADPHACRRYTGLLLGGVPTQPAPLWMQLRLGHVGLRPITGLVDLTNYIMLDLGQPMHAFDAAHVDRIEVDWAKKGERFTTLDGVERTFTNADLMIQSQGRSVAVAGVMGGLETEVAESTTTLLLESANFDPATIRKTAIRLGLRTDASARFEKSLDPENTVLAVQRFIELAKPMYPAMKLTGRLSDAHPQPAGPTTVTVNPRHVARTIGRDVPTEEIESLLTPLGFTVEKNETLLTVQVPSYRAANDVSIEDDIIEELARYIGYNSFEPALPHVSVRRFEPNALHELEQRTLEYFTTAHAFHEIHAYLWYAAAWLKQLGFEPGICPELANPAAEGLHLLRGTLLPGLLASLSKNRYHFPEVSLIEVGSVFDVAKKNDMEHRHLGLIHARRGKRVEDELYAQAKGAIEGWAWQRFARQAAFAPASPDANRPWEHPQRTADILIDERSVGRISVIDLALRRAMDEHLGAWGVVWAEIKLSGLDSIDHQTEPLDPVPEYPLVEMDFSVVVPAALHYRQVSETLGAFDHPLLKRMRFVTAYEGEPLGAGHRSLTFRTFVGHDSKTMTDDDANGFRNAFEQYLANKGFDLRR